MRILRCIVFSGLIIIYLVLFLMNYLFVHTILDKSDYIILHEVLSSLMLLKCQQATAVYCLVTRKFPVAAGYERQETLTQQFICCRSNNWQL